MSFKQYFSLNPLRFILFTICSAIVPIFVVISTYITQQSADVLLARDIRDFVILLLLAFLFGFVLYGAQSLANYLSVCQEQDLNHQVRKQIVKHYYNDNKVHKVSDMQNRLTNDLQLINTNYYEMIYNLIYGIVLIIGIVIYLILLNWQLLITILVMVAISLFLPKITEKPLQKATKYISDSNQEYLTVLNEWLSGLAQIQQFLAGAKLFSISEKASKHLEDANVKQTAYTQLLRAVNGIVSAAFGLILMILVGFLIQNGQITVGALLVIGNFRFYLKQGIEMITASRGMMKGTNKLIEEVNQSASPIDVKTKQDLVTPSSFKTENLSLQFPNGEKLTYPDMEIKPGEKILLTGDSGAGKSTLFKLILGELTPSTGYVIFKDQTGKYINPDLSELGYIPQDPVVFPVSIKDNITMFDNLFNQQVKQVVSEVNLTNDIAKFTDGLDEQLNLDKLNISGGQRQKIVLARAKIHNSQIILIDEGTSAIDQQATMNILHNLVKTPATIIFIAHNFNEHMRQLFDREIHLIKE